MMIMLLENGLVVLALRINFLKKWIIYFFKNEKKHNFYFLKLLKNKEIINFQYNKNLKNAENDFWKNVKMYINVNCRKSNKKVFLEKSIYINSLKKNDFFFIILCIDFWFFLSYNVLRKKVVGGKLWQKLMTY